MTPFGSDVDQWQRDMERLLRKAREWNIHVSVNGNQELTSMSVNAIVAPPMVCKVINVKGD